MEESGTMRTGTISQDMGESQASTWGLLDTFDKVTATSQWNLAHESWLGEVLVGIVIYFLAFTPQVPSHLNCSLLPLPPYPLVSLCF